jgi:hypothetical protein
MKKTIVLLTFLSSCLFSSDNIWTKETQGMSESKSEKIINAYLKGETQELNFEDDPEVKKYKLDITENIFTLGLSVGGSSATDTVSNTTGSQTLTNDSYSVKLIVGKDFTFWHENYTQPTRLYLTYAYTTLGSVADMTTWTLGIKENMYYWPIYTADTYSIYPTFSLEFGRSALHRDSISDIDGYTTEADLGINYVRDNNFEYSLNLNVSNTIWEYPLDGIAYETLSFGVFLGVTYKFNYGDFY